MLTELCARRIPAGNIHAFCEVAERLGPVVEPGSLFAPAIATQEDRRATR